MRYQIDPKTVERIIRMLEWLHQRWGIIFIDKLHVDSDKQAFEVIGLAVNLPE
jgi:hypothetical protein